jgi:hypothetical protein
MIIGLEIIDEVKNDTSEKKENKEENKK